MGTNISESIKNGTISINHLTYDRNTSTYNLRKNIVWIGSSLENLYIQLSGETFNGHGHTISVGLNGTSNSYGLFSIDSGSDVSTIKNLKVKSTVTTNGAGGVVRQNQSNFKLINCHHYGNIEGQSAGGLCGQGTVLYASIVKCTSHGDILGNYAGGICGDASSANIYKCYHYGSINATESGGIVGRGFIDGYIYKCKHYGDITSTKSGGIAGSNTNSLIYINSCSSNGNITGDESGGICGSYAQGNIKNCKSMGNIEGNGCGGIMGSYCGSIYPSSFVSETDFNTFCYVNGCYSSGNITGNNAGGICGFYTSLANYNGGIGSGCNSTCNISNCYSLGSISGQYAGGICGSYTSVSISSNNIFLIALCTIIDCYSIGNISTTCGGICGDQTSNTTQSTTNITNCYASGQVSNTNGWGIVNNTEGNSGNIIFLNCYSQNQENSLTLINGKLDQLDPISWKSTHKLPILRTFIKGNGVWKKYKHNYDQSKFNFHF